MRGGKTEEEETEGRMVELSCSFVEALLFLPLRGEMARLETGGKGGKGRERGEGEESKELECFLLFILFIYVLFSC